MRFPDFLRDKKAVRFAILSFLIVMAALATAVISAAAAQLGEYDLASLTSKIALGLALVIAVYVVPRLAQNVRLELLRSNLSLNITNAGWLFCSFILVVGIASLSTGNNLLYVVLATLLSTLVVSGVASRLNINDSGVMLRFPDHIFAGEPTRLEITLTNQKGFTPSFALTVAVAAEKERRGFRRRKRPESAAVAKWRQFSPALKEAYFPIIPGRTNARMDIDGCFERRGVYPISGFTIHTRFPFGFVERRRFIEATGEIIVYPQPQPLDDFYHLLPISQGQMESLLKGSGSDLYAIRQYLRSDHQRHVDWKATARTAQLMVREFTRDDDWRITVAFDNYTGDAGDEFNEKFERAITLAASLITHFITEGADVRLVVGGDDLGFGGDESHRYTMLRCLARLSPAEDGSHRRNTDGGSARGMATPENKTAGDESTAWGLLERMPALAADDQFKILITPSPRGSIPASVWRAAHVVYFDDL
ncbi:MAG TPA: DUF58 domain-containing protein [Blastocatellia bacterium]|nr:DUF58 domain-containing protein [Blastocatellia bacterium]